LYLSEVRNHYYAHLSARYQKQQAFMTWLSLLSSSGAAGAFISSTVARSYPFLSPVLAIGTAALCAYSLVAKKERKGIDSSRLSTKWGQLAQKYEVLFGQMDTELADTLTKLEEKRSELSESAHTLALKPKLMLKSQHEVKNARRLK
jgi:hypothetical protein